MTVPPYSPNLEAIRWVEDPDHGPSRRRTWRCWLRCPHHQTMPPPSYHDLYVTTAEIPRTRLFDLPYGLEITFRAAVTCSRVAGWELWQTHTDISKWKLLAGEYDDNWLILDVAGHVIVNSRDRQREDA